METVIGIDVGGERKGFHAVAFSDGKFFDKKADVDPILILNWCLQHRAMIIAVDAPCRWAELGSSRKVERDLRLFGQKIKCFSTPMRESAVRSETNFYGWVFNGERLYQQLQSQYPLINGLHNSNHICVETFPHAVACALAGEIVSAKQKARRRRDILETNGFDVGILSNIDFVDAALCAVAADALSKNRYQSFGDSLEGFILLPA